MKDRVVQHPHRYQLVPVAGESDTYDIIAKPGTITEAGTPLNKATLLSDTTAALYGLTGDDATVDGALYTALANNKVFGLKDVLCVRVGPNSVAGAIPFTSQIFSRGSKLSFSTESSTKITINGLSEVLIMYYSTTGDESGTTGHIATSVYLNGSEVSTIPISRTIGYANQVPKGIMTIITTLSVSSGDYIELVQTHSVGRAIDMLGSVLTVIGLE